MKFKNFIIPALLFVGVLFYLSFKSDANTSFLIHKNEDGIELSENGIPILFYQKRNKSLGGKYERNNYIHPLYNLKGEVITEDFPEDHPYHRGVYWAWHQIYVEDSLVSDSWSLDNFNSSITNSIAEIKGNAVLVQLTSEWSSPKYAHGEPYLREETQFTIYKLTDDFRMIDVKIALNPLVENLKLGGANNKKGYGGLCLRIKMPEDLTFSSKKGIIKPETFQVDAGSWMNFSANFKKESNFNGIALFCHSSNWGYPQKWILRQKSSMQNIVFPGQESINIPVLDPVVLNYRLLIHEGLSGENLLLQEKIYNQKRID